jgi:hypothetical protein
VHYGWNASIVLPSEKANDAINIVRAAKAAKITVRLNLRIRRSYARTQSVSLVLTGLLPQHQAIPCVSQHDPYQAAAAPTSDKQLSRKANLSPPLESWKMQKT